MQENRFTYNNIAWVGYWKKNISLSKNEVNNWIEKCYDYKLSNPSSKKSNIGGYQSNPSINSFPAFKPLVNFLEKEWGGLHNQEIGKINEMWFNISNHGNHNMKHNHSNSELSTKLSGVLYLQTPEKSGDIVFYNPYINSQWVPYTPVVGDLLLFPDYLEHSVQPNLSQEDRISIAFNYE